MSGVTWVTCDRADLPGSLGWLATEERLRLDAFRIAKRRDDYLLGRWTAKRAIAARMSPSPPLETIAIRAAADGAPEAFLDDAPLAFTVSVSHSLERALLGAPDQRDHAIAPIGRARGDPGGLLGGEEVTDGAFGDR